MQIKYPKINCRWNGKDYEAAVEIIRNYLKVAVYISPLAWWKAYELIRDFIR